MTVSSRIGEGQHSVLLTGAASQIGYFLIPRLAAAGYRVQAVSRRGELQATRIFGSRWGGAGAAHWVQADPVQPGLGVPARGCSTWIHLGPLALLPPRLGEMAAAGVSRVIAFGSTSRFTKADSVHPKDQRTVATLAAGEAALASECTQHGLGWTLFRPTLIHGAGLDRNVMVIAGAIRRFRFFPLVGGGAGLRQPVHADDLALACVQAIGTGQSRNRAYDLSGGEVLSYRDMVIRIFAALDRPARFLPVPVAAVGLALWGLSHLPRYRDFNVEMARRMTQDMVFAHDEAAHAFAFSPRGFQPLVEPPA